MYLVPTFNPHRPVSPAEVQERGTNSLFVASSAPLRKRKSKSSALQMAAVRADFIHDDGHKIMAATPNPLDSRDTGAGVGGDGGGGYGGEGEGEGQGAGVTSCTR